MDQAATKADRISAIFDDLEGWFRKSAKMNHPDLESATPHE